MGDKACNKWLLYHYLKKSYTDIGIDDKKAEELTDSRILGNSKNLFQYYGLAWQPGQISLEFFCMYFLQDIYISNDTFIQNTLDRYYESAGSNTRDSSKKYLK